MQTKIYNECKNSFELPGRVLNAREDSTRLVHAKVTCEAIGCNNEVAIQKRVWERTCDLIIYCKSCKP